jgi:hypothetical protein
MAEILKNNKLRKKYVLFSSIVIPATFFLFPLVLIILSIRVYDAIFLSMIAGTYETILEITLLLVKIPTTVTVEKNCVTFEYPCRRKTIFFSDIESFQPYKPNQPPNSRGWYILLKRKRIFGNFFLLNHVDFEITKKIIQQYEYWKTEERTKI